MQKILKYVYEYDIVFFTTNRYFLFISCELRENIDCTIKLKWQFNYTHLIAELDWKYFKNISCKDRHFIWALSPRVSVSRSNWINKHGKYKMCWKIDNALPKEKCKQTMSELVLWFQTIMMTNESNHSTVFFF